MAHHLYIDATASWEEGMRLAAGDSGTCADLEGAIQRGKKALWWIDFGTLIRVAGTLACDLRRASLYGVQPFDIDSLWSGQRFDGYELVVKPRLAGPGSEK